MKKKIMHIIQSPGGVERYIQMFLENVNKEKFENILVCSYDFKKENYRDNVLFFEQVDMIREINFISDLKAILKVRNLIKKYKPDIVYMHSSKAGAIGRIANFGINNISLYNPHGWAFNMMCSNKMRITYIIIEKLLALITDKIITISEFEKESAINNKICKSYKIEVIFNGIDIEKYKNKKIKLNRKQLGIPENAYLIGTVGRITKQKAPDTFIRAAAKIKEKIPNAFFILVGDGEDRFDIEKLIIQLNLNESTIITGWVDETIEYISLFDQAMLLSRWEGFGLVLTEYMISNKAIIATNINAIPNLIYNNKSGILVEVDNIDEIVEATIKLKNNKELKKSLIINAKNNVEKNFDIKRVLKEHEILIDNLYMKNKNI